MIRLLLILLKNTVVLRLNNVNKYKRIVSEFKLIVLKYKLSPEQLRHSFKLLREDTGLVVRKREKKLPKFLTPAETYHFLSVAQSLTPRHRLLCEFLIQTGLRISELQKLDLRDIDQSNNTLKVVEGKGSKDRFVPIGNSLIQQVNLFVGGRKQGQIFLNSTHKSLSTRRLQQMFQEVAITAGLGVLNPHIARHTYACILINKGFNLEDLQLFMGHSSKITTEIYAKLAFTPDQKNKYLTLFP